MLNNENGYTVVQLLVALMGIIQIAASCGIIYVGIKWGIPMVCKLYALVMAL